MKNLKNTLKKSLLGTFASVIPAIMAMTLILAVFLSFPNNAAAQTYYGSPYNNNSNGYYDSYGNYNYYNGYGGNGNGYGYDAYGHGNHGGNGNNGNFGNISLSQTSINIGANQSANISIYGGNSQYYISNNSNPSIASASVSGSILRISSNINGNTTITVCGINNNYNSSGCATLYVTVQNNSYGQPVYLSQNSLNLNIGQGQAISLYGPGSYYISSNSNPSAISSLVSSDVLNVYGSGPGSGTLNVCSSSSNNGGCAKLYVTVGGYTGYYNNNNYNNYGYNYNPYYGTNYSGYNGYNNYNYSNLYNPIVSSVPNTYYVSGYNSNAGYVSRASQVYLNQIPATGIGFGLKTYLFIIGLVLWSLFMSYVFISRKRRKLVFNGR